MEEQLKEVQKEFPNAWLGINHHTGKVDIYYIPISWCNSLFITKL